MKWLYIFFVSMKRISFKSEQLQQISSFGYLLTEKKIFFKQTGTIAKQKSVLDLIGQGHKKKASIIFKVFSLCLNVMVVGTTA